MRIDEILKKKKTLSFEVFPPKKDQGSLDKIFSTIDDISTLKPDFISVTYGAGGSNSKNTVEIANYIKNKAHVEALAHLTGGSSSFDDVNSICEELKKSGIENIMSLRGDRPLDYDGNYCKNFAHASDLNKYILERYDFTLGGACYPEGHQESDILYEDLINLKIKQDSGAKFLITQVFYDNQYFYRFLREARKIGITIPIIAGIMPLTSTKSVLRVSKMCGSAVPLSLRSMIERYKNDNTTMKEIGINYAIHQILDLLANDVDGVHLYIMNNFSVAKTIYERIENIIEKEFR